jgi:hypothetical protein
MGRKCVNMVHPPKLFFEKPDAWMNGEEGHFSIFNPIIYFML